MKLTKFCVSNYKVFKNRFSIDFSTDSIAILTGRNNTGKSTFLEAINCFFKKETKTTTIPFGCYSNPNNEIILEAIFESDKYSVKFIKKYKSEGAPKFYDWFGAEIKPTHSLKAEFDKIFENKPFYITPSMSTEDIHSQVQGIYSQIIKNDLDKLDDTSRQMGPLTAKESEMRFEYSKIKDALPEFLSKLKSNTDTILTQVSSDVSKDLQGLFSNDNLSLKVIGGESAGFTSNDILKSTSSSIYIDSVHQKEMPLINQGTGLQRMSLIYVIQNMIQKKLLGENDDKLLLIDEPEAFLHPEAVRALSRSLYEIGSKMPLIISTHSPVLIDLSEKHTSIQVFRVGEQSATQLYKSKNDQFDDDDIKNMKILNYADSYVNEFFFAEKIIIVEGDTEFIALKHLLKENNINVHIIRARGKSTICTIMKILNQFNTDYDVLHDLDNHSRYSTDTLKSQLTNCKNILKLKTKESIKIFSSVANFELAIGIGDVDNKNKTKTIYEIIHNESTDPRFTKAKAEIDNFFNYVFQYTAEAKLGDNFIQINCNEDYEKMFLHLIEEEKIVEEAPTK